MGLEGLCQFRAGTGGNDLVSRRYFADQQQWLAGAMVTYEPESWNLSLNYLHLGKDGRFLFPREWGREQFFATLPRGRMEGTGNSDLLVAKAIKRWSDRCSFEGDVVRSWLPPTTNYRLNKYGALSYWGWIMDLNYQPARSALQGLHFRLLYVGWFTPGRELPLADLYYTSNFHNLNLVTQLSF